MKRQLFMALLTAFMLQVSAQSYPPKDTPQLEFALQLKVTLGQAFSIENTQHGRRTVIPITGGTFEGPGIKGTIINGGADYQLANAQGRMLTANRRSISVLLHSSRLPPTVSTAG